MILNANELPADVATIAGKVAEFLGVELGDLIFRDAQGERLTPGAYCIAYAELDEWTYEFLDAIDDRAVRIPRRWRIVRGDSWKLHLYRSNVAPQRTTRYTV